MAFCLVRAIVQRVANYIIPLIFLIVSRKTSIRSAQEAIAFTQGVLTGFTQQRQIALPKSYKTVSTKHYTHHRRHNWERAIIGQFVGDVQPMTIIAGAGNFSIK